MATTSASRPVPGSVLPAAELPLVGGGSVSVGRPSAGFECQLAITYRGIHCPLCKKYVESLKETAAAFAALGIELVVLSADTKDQAEAFEADTGLTASETPIKLAYGLTIEHAYKLGLFVSSRMAHELPFGEHLFPEPGLHLTYGDGRLWIVDISNAPFSRPDLKALAAGLSFAVKNSYPPRGTRLEDGTVVGAPSA